MKKKKEKDNKGKRLDKLALSNVYQEVRYMMKKFSPFILYIFDEEKDACTALLELDCIHEAKDTGSLICTENIIFGCYEREDGLYEAILAGENLTHNLWLKAKENFEKYGGTPKKEKEL